MRCPGSARAWIALGVALALAAPGLAQAPAPSSGPPVVEARVEVRVEALPAPAVTLAPHRDGVAVLLQDGRLLHVAGASSSSAGRSSAGASGARARTLTRGLEGEVLAACAGRLLAIDAATGRLIHVGGRFGPPVSLHATPLCLPGGGVLAIDPEGDRILRLGAALEVEAAALLAALPDAEAVRLADGSVALPSEPTLRYRHGVLGDEVEAGAATLVDPVTLETRARWRPADDVVIEQRRLLPFPAAGANAMVATLSGGGDGGALAVLASSLGDPTGLAVVARAPGLGRERRWRHVLGASGPRIYAVATPHVGGPVERFTFARTADGPRLTREAFPLGVTSHRIGRRELDLGRLLPRASADPDDLDLLLLPTRDLTGLRLIACDRAGCAIAARADLPAALAAAPWAERTDDGGVRVWAADVAAGLTRLRFPRDGVPGNSE